NATCPRNRLCCSLATCFLALMTTAWRLVGKQKRAIPFGTNASAEIIPPLRSRLRAASISLAKKGKQLSLPRNGNSRSSRKTNSETVSWPRPRYRARHSFYALALNCTELRSDGRKGIRAAIHVRDLHFGWRSEQTNGPRQGAAPAWSKDHGRSNPYHGQKHGLAGPRYSQGPGTALWPVRWSLHRVENDPKRCRPFPGM